MTKNYKNIFGAQHLVLVTTLILSFVVAFSFQPIVEARSNTTGMPEEQLYAPGQIIIKFKDQSSPEVGFLQQYNLKSVKKILSQHKFAGKAKEKVEASGLNRLYVAELDSVSSFKGVLRALNQNSRVEYAEPNYIVSALLQPNDPSFSQLWGMHNTGQTGGTSDADIDAPEAWDIRTSTSLIIGIIDTGIDYTHQDLADNMWLNPGEIANNGIDDDGNGFIDDVYGWDFFNNDNNPFDDHGHGTHVAGTIGAKGDNGVGVAGVNWTAKVAALKFLSSGGSGTTAGAIEAVGYANMMGFKVTNNSWGGGGFSQALYDAISAANTAGNLFVAAAGNSGVNTDISPMYPAAYDLPNIISVAATDHNDLKASFSNYGLISVDLGAPGVNIYSTVPTGSCSLCDPSGYKLLSGTSMATPHTAGAAALMWSHAPSATHLAVKDILMNSSDPISALAGITVSGGRLNVYNALLAANPSKGVVSLDKNVYTVPATVAVTVVDLDLDITPSPDTVTVELISTTEQIPEVLTLTETGTNTAVFTGSIDLVTGTPASDGKLQVTHGDTIIVTYYDAFDGTGPATITDTAIVDSQAPVISSVNSSPGRTWATITWITDELSDSVVRYGTSPTNLNLMAFKSAMVKSHSLELSGLVPETTYYFDVESTDEAGNAAIDNNNGLHHTFTTLQQVVAFSDDMEKGLNGWVVEGSTDGVTPDGGLWHQSQRKATSPVTSWYYGKESAGDYNTGFRNWGNITSPDIDLSAIKDSELLFQHYLETENLSPYDIGMVQVSRDNGISWTTVLSKITTNGAWVKESVNISAFDQSTIKVRFFFDTLDSLYNNFEGWYVDDVQVIGGPITPNTKPIANVGGPYSGIEDTSIVFDGSGSFDQDGDPLTYIWDFGDGKSLASSSPIINHTYLQGGIYTVTLVVNDGFVNSDPSATTVDVTEVNDPPIANAGPDQSGTVSKVLTFDGSDSSDEEGPLVSYFWDFGDGNSASGAVVTHSYSVTGNFTVTLTVTDSGGLTAQDTLIASIIATDVVDITKAAYNNGKKQLTVEAWSSSGGKATLTVIGYGTMIYDPARNLYELVVNNVATNPGTVTVTSSFGGTDTKKVIGKK